MTLFVLMLHLHATCVKYIVSNVFLITSIFESRSREPLRRKRSKKLVLK
jgi:hypothetical protein